MCNKIVGVNGDEGTPVPIPNTVVKLVYGDNTWLATAREDNSTPTPADRRSARYSSIAQLVEHAAVNRRVVGSSPTGGATSEQAPLTLPHLKDGVFVCFRCSSFSAKSHARLTCSVVNALATFWIDTKLFWRCMSSNLSTKRDKTSFSCGLDMSRLYRGSHPAHI